MFILQVLISPLFDTWIFYKISKQKIKKTDFFFILFLCSIIFLLFKFEILRNDFLLSFLESTLFFIYFYKRIDRKRILLSSIIIFELVDLILAIILGLINVALDPSNTVNFLIEAALQVVAIIIISGYSNFIHNLITNKNSLIFLITIFYIYLSSTVTFYFVLRNKELSEALQISIGLLIFQSIFALLLYFGMVKIQKNILSEEEEKRRSLELKLAKLENKELALQKNKLISENKQIKEYTDYLDKNEDELRRFKHDYQNILNSLKVSAQNGDVKAVVEQLDKYSNTQFDQKALRKYKDVNHIHIDELKSIVIAKLSKLYSMNINYSFGCNTEITTIPNTVDLIDITRIIGIAFDNATEESQELIKETNDHNAAKISAMYYKKYGDFEFEIKNRVRQSNSDVSQLEQKNYTTKKHHMGMGLANVKDIAKKYEDSLMINYEVKDNWFTFSLVILPDTIMEEE